MLWPRQKDVTGEETKTNYVKHTAQQKEKWTPKGNVDGRNTSSHDNKNLEPDQEIGITFGFWKTATALEILDR
jgi:hypothetical protein